MGTEERFVNPELSDQQTELIPEELPVIMAVIEAYEGDRSNQLVVRKISRISGQSTAWTDAGRAETINSRKF